ncbi:MAG: hypothetical protein U0992_15365 [Planctomycetaceae bacterium]
MPIFASCIGAAVLMFAGAIAYGAEPGAPVELGLRRELFVDRYLIESLDGAELFLHEPRDSGSVIAFDNPWEGRFCGYTTIIRDGDVLRMYYRGMPDAKADGSDAEVTCYAESNDGLAWTKPNLRLFEVQGTRDNNVILSNAAPVTHNFCPFLDVNPAALPEQRYKAVGGTAKSGLIGYVSPDGIHWTKLREEPVFRDKEWVFDSQNVPLWSVSENCYVLYYRRAVDGIRAIARSTSPDFVNWTEPVQMMYSDTESGRPSQHLYTNQTQPYFRAPQIYVATAARFMPGRQVVNDEQADAIGVHPSYFHDTSDAVFMSSRGGDRYDRSFLGSLIRPGIGLKNWVSRTNYPALNVVQTGPTEMSLYVQQDYGQLTAHLQRYTLRLDGFASVRAPFGGGELVTRPVTFAGNRLSLNFSTSAAGGIRVEVQDVDGQALPGFTLDDSVETIGNEIERDVRWKNGADVGALAGRPVKLRFVMNDADLFALRFYAAR